MWNEACDFASNPVLLEMGLLLPPGVLNDAQYHKKTPEEIYYLLMQKKANQPPKPQSGKAGQQGAEAAQPGPPGGDDEGDDKSASKDPKPGSESSRSSDADEKDSESCDKKGDASGEGRLAGPIPKDDPDGATEPERSIRPFGEIHQNTKPAHEVELKEITKVAATQAQQRGHLSGGVKRVIKDVLQSPVDWIPLTHLFVQRIAPTDYLWRRPNRNYLQQGFYAPSLWENRLGPLFFGNDTSGSVSNFQQDCSQKMLQDLATEARPESITVVHCDSKVKKIEEFVDGDIINISPVGGGGTDFRPVFDEIERQGDSPAGLIFLTDMAGTFPKVAPDYPVLWLSTTPDVQGPFGETVYLDLRKH